MKQLTFFILIFITSYSFSQEPVLKVLDSNKLMLLEEKVKTLEKGLGEAQSDINKLEMKISNDIEGIKNETNKNIAAYKQDTKDLINLYVFLLLAE